MKSELVSFQLGKHGLTGGFIDLLEKTFKKHDLVRITVLRNATRDKALLKEMSIKICNELKRRINKDFTIKTIGFTLYVKKWRKKI